MRVGSRGTWLGLGLAVCIGCGGGGSILPLPNVGNGKKVFALTDTGKLIQFRTATPGNVENTFTITGLQAGEVLRALDTRPATGQLYAASSTRLYTLSQSGAATLVAVLNPSITGALFDIDFNPVVDRIRVVTSDRQNLRVHPDTGAVTVDTDLAYAAGDVSAGQQPSVGAAAYTNSVTPAPAATSLFVYDLQPGGADRLARVGGVNGPPSPNGGEMTTIGSDGLDLTSIGFDIDSDGKAYIAAAVQGNIGTRFMIVDMGTAVITNIGQIGQSDPVLAITVER